MMFAKRFQHLGEIERKRIVMPENVTMRLNRLERPEPWPEGLLKAIGNSAALDSLQQYPGYAGFYARLARFFHLPEDGIVVGAGIEEFIRSLFMLCIEPGDKVAFLWPTCAMFELYARAFGAIVVRIVADPADPLTCDALVEQLPDDLKLLLLANPGQPVETCFGFAELSRIAEACQVRGAVFAIDEAYHGFGAPTAMHPPSRFDNVVVLRTFSKAFGAASIRLGFASGSPAVIAGLNAIRQSGEVSALSMHIATVLMGHYLDIVRPAIELICMGRDSLRRHVTAELGFRAWGECSNHVLIELPDAGGVADRLAARGVLVKAGFPAPIDRHILVTCGGPALMDRFFDELKAAL